MYFYVLSVFLCSSVHSGSHFQRMSRGNILIRHKQKDVVMPKKIQYGLPKTTTYVQRANMQFIHGPITALNDETVTAKRLNHFLKIRMCLYLGQKEEKTSHTSSISEKNHFSYFYCKMWWKQDKNLVFLFVLQHQVPTSCHWLPLLHPFSSATFNGDNLWIKIWICQCWTNLILSPSQNLSSPPVHVQTPALIFN